MKKITQKELLDQYHKALDNKKEYLTQEGYENGYIPISGGNTLAVYEYLKLWQGRDIETYKLFLAETKYWVNRYDVVNCKALRKVWTHLRYTAFIYGASVVKKWGNEYIPLGVLTTQIDYNMNIKKWKGWVSNISFLGSTNPSVAVAIKLTEEDSLPMKWDFQGIPQIWFWLPFCYSLKNLLQAFKTNIYSSVNKFQYEIYNNNSEVKNEEIASFFSLDSPLIKRIVNRKNYQWQNGESPNKFTAIEKMSSNNNIDIIQQMRDYQSYYYTKFGRTSNDLQKSERVNLQELQPNKVNAKIVASEVEYFALEWVKNFNKKYNENAILIDKETMEEVKDIELKTLAKVGKNGNSKD